jgi:hypothetical protein
MSEKHLRVVVGVPSGQHWLAQFGVDLGSLMVRFYMQRVPGYKSQELRVANVRSSILPKNRLDIIKVAEKVEADYLLFIDSDHTFPADLLHRLIAHNKPIVAANCVTKTIPAQPTARGFKEGNLQGEVIYSDPDTHGLQQVWRVGTGIMLIRRDAFEKIPHSAWEMVYRAEGDTYQGEDWTFCESCAALDIPIYIDHDVSRSIGHIGNFEYTHDYVGEVITNAP